jgi:sulfite reductase (NADPH) hemoprotein beta-component
MSPEPGSPKPLVANEAMKAGSRHLRGSLAEELQDTTTGGIAIELNNQLTKFHGLYMQDDRDVRNIRKKEGKEKAFGFMLRVRLPGGRATPAQWRTLDDLATEYATPSLRITTRQTFQFHGILKGNVKKHIQRMHQVMLDSRSACGDVNRNVVAPPNPERSPLLQELYEQAKAWAEYALPKTRAYHEIFLDEELVAGGEPEREPMYGETYLPRKFKTGFGLPPHNDVDIYSQDLGFIAIADGDRLLGYNVVAGGGQGLNHGNPKTYPRLASDLGFITPENVIKVAEAVLTTQRDYGDRTDRKHARLKYTIDDRGEEWFIGEVEQRSGVKFQPTRPVEWTSIQDPTGWQQCGDGTWFYGLHILSGRVKDIPGWPMKTALREIANLDIGDFRMTTWQNLNLSGIKAEQKPLIDAILNKHGLAAENNRSALRLNALSCVALPTCGLALGESERILPEILEKFEAVLEEAGLRDDAISLRITGCPNGCARPYLAEIGFVGKAPGKYALYLGAKYNGTRLNRLVSPSITVDGAVAMLTPIIKRYALEREEGEGFGDFCDRVIIPADATLHSIGTVVAPEPVAV